MVSLTSAHVHKNNTKLVTKFYFRCRDGKRTEQELGWRVSVLPIPAFHHCELYNYVLHVHSVQ